ncbi:MAG: efflux RND transporter permease subunit [Panacagrimonas sp.]
MFERVVSGSLGHRRLVLLSGLVLVLLGALQAWTLPVDVLPELSRPTVSVHVESPKLSASDADTQVAWPLSAALAGLPYLVRLRASSIAGLSTLQAEFEWGTDPYRNRQLVNERIDVVRSQLPRGAEPRLAPPTSLMGEIMLVALRGTGNDPGLRKLRSLADWTLRPALLGVPGVSQVTVIGGEVAQWEVQPDPARLKFFGVTLQSLADTLRGYGETRGGGILSAEGREHGLRGASGPFSPEALGNVAIDHRAAGPVWLHQVATVAEGARVRRGSAGTNASPAVILAVQKQPGADTRAVTGEVEARLAQLDGQLPAQTLRTTVFRQADFINISIGHVRDAFAHGVLIVAIVLALFLSGGRTTVISLVAIPLSVAGAMLGMGLLGLTVNTLTLGGLAIAVGELVDDSVVGVENVVRRLRQFGQLTTRTVIDATMEVRAGILQASLVIVAGFLPLLGLGGVEGRLFGSLATAYIAAILSSLLVAITVTPVLCWLGFGGTALAVPQERRWLTALKSVYARALTRSLAHGKWLLAASLAVLVVAGAILFKLPRSFLPLLNESTLTVTLVLKPGLALEESERVGRAAEQLILGLPEVLSVGRRTGRAELDEHAEGVHYSELDLQLRHSHRPRIELLADLRRRLEVLPGTISIGQPISHRIDHLLAGARAPLAIRIYGQHPRDIDSVATRVRALLAADPRLREGRTDEEAQVREARVEVDAARAALYGLSPPRVLEAVGRLVPGEVLSTLIEPQRRVDLVLRLPAELRSVSRLDQLPLDSPLGPVPLGWVATIVNEPVSASVVREGGRRRVLISVSPAGSQVEPAVQDLRKAIAGLALPEACEIEIQGRQVTAGDSAARLLTLGLVSLLAIAALLLLQFRDVAAVAIVMLSIPFAWAGGALALGLTGTELSVASVVGFVTVAGIAARNSILKLGRYMDTASRESATNSTDFVVQRTLDRLTPVLMTTAAAAASLVPFLSGSDQPGLEVLHPVALVVLGGMVASVVQDSFLTPALFVMWRARHRPLSD